MPEFEAVSPSTRPPDQTRAIDEVLRDLERPDAMDRVVCGDVGFGKTEVAMRAAFRVAMAGRQVAMLVPDHGARAAAHQHFRDRMADYPCAIGQLSRFVSKEEQAATLRSSKRAASTS